MATADGLLYDRLDQALAWADQHDARGTELFVGVNACSLEGKTKASVPAVPPGSILTLQRVYQPTRGAGQAQKRKGRFRKKTITAGGGAVGSENNGYTVECNATALVWSRWEQPLSTAHLDTALGFECSEAA
jgi:hypothetical protein